MYGVVRRMSRRPGRGGGGRSSSRDYSSHSDGNVERARPPPGLRGKAIGMWYAARSKEKKPVDTRPKFSFSLNVPDTVENEIKRTLSQLAENKNSPCTNHEFMAEYITNLSANAQADVNTADVDVPQLLLNSLRNEEFDTQLLKELEDKKSKEQYKALLAFREKLPAYAFMKEVTDVISQNQVTVISGETGSGKTTQIPQFILDRCISDGNGSICNIICTQPRRISTITVAERVAEERCERVGGNSVGYSIRLESRLPKRAGGTLTFLVTGVLLSRLRVDPYLTGVTHVIVDEVHERDTLSDFTLVILKDLIRKRRDLKVILMSATLNADKFSEYFEGCETFQIPGFTFPVTQYYLEDVLERTKFVYERTDQKRRWSKENSESEFDCLILPWVEKCKRENRLSPAVLNQLRNPDSEKLNLDLIQATLEHIVETDETLGAVLIFVPGWEQISNLVRQLEASGRFHPTRFILYPLHSLMPTSTQKEIFTRPPPGVRKIIISTNIAETSITIDDVVFVIDCGRIKLTSFNIDRNIGMLNSEWVSRANARQRKGRAGRVREGVCYHLFSRGRERLLEDFKKPEIQRTKLEESVLRIKNLKYGNASSFFRKFPDPPDEKMVDLALERLRKIGALDSAEQLTPLGFHLSKLPMDPYTGKMILMAAIFSVVDPVFSCAASLSFKDCFQIPLGHEKQVDAIRKRFAGDTRSDHIAVIRAVQGYDEAKAKGRDGNFCWQNYISQGTMKNLQSVKAQFAEYLHGMGFLPTTDVKDAAVNRNSSNTALIKAVICSGLYPNLAIAKTRRIGRGGKKVVARTQEDGKVELHPKSVNSKIEFDFEFESPFLVYFQKMKSSSVFLYDSTMVTPFPLVFFGGELDYVEQGGYSSLGVDGDPRLLCTQSVYDIFQELRRKLDEVLARKINNPGPTHWEETSDNTDNHEWLLLRAIRDLLTAEHERLMTADDDDDFD